MAQQRDEHWVAYLADVDGEPAAVLVDLGWVDSTPDPERPVCMRVSIRFHDAGEDGLGEREEADAIGDREDDLVEVIAERLRAEHVGRVRSGGELSWYFYGPWAEGFEELAADRVRALMGYSAECEVDDDPEWSLYLDGLYPPPPVLRLIGDEEVVEQLRENGDSLATPRRVEHIALFEQEEEAAAFARHAEAQGYEAEIAHSDDSEDWPYVVTVAHVSPVDLATIHGVTTALEEAAEEQGGVYDGWGTELVGGD